MLEENFEEMQWALEELKTNYILLKAYTSLKEDLKKAYTEKDLKICEKLLRVTQSSLQTVIRII